jgi:hypothetical protein
VKKNLDVYITFGMDAQIIVNVKQQPKCRSKEQDGYIQDISQVKGHNNANRKHQA